MGCGGEPTTDPNAGGDGNAVPVFNKLSPKDFESLKALAEQGDATAQLNLGVQYVDGNGVPQDYVTAYAWWDIAQANGGADAKKGKDIIAREMTADQIAEGQKLSREMLKKNPKLLK